MQACRHPPPPPSPSLESSSLSPLPLIDSLDCSSFSLLRLWRIGIDDEAARIGLSGGRSGRRRELERRERLGSVRGGSVLLQEV
jgi:hypothetical protein